MSFNCIVSQLIKLSAVAWIKIHQLRFIYSCRANEFCGSLLWRTPFGSLAVSLTWIESVLAFVYLFKFLDFSHVHDCTISNSFWCGGLNLTIHLGLLCHLPDFGGYPKALWMVDTTASVFINVWNTWSWLVLQSGLHMPY